MIHNLCRPRFNHEYALSRLKAEGYRLAVGSNSVRPSIEMMLYHAKLTQYFEFMLSNEDVRKAKPDPEIYLKSMEKMDLLPEECLIVEDNENGIKAAVASGGHLMAVKTVEDVTYDNIKRRILEVESGAQ
jgi:HAD superfamily hydrolase (TIGR01509 family)